MDPSYEEMMKSRPAWQRQSDSERHIREIKKILSERAEPKAH